MTTTNYTVGIGNDDKVSSKVLKPPGGETHDIFGTKSCHVEAMPHRNTNHLQSSVFGDDRPAAGQSPTATSGRKHGNHGGGASTIVFGAGVDEEDEQPRKVKDYQKSNVFGERNEPSYLNGNHGIRRYNNSQGLGAGNPITGEGYANGAATNNGNANGEQAKEDGQNNSRIRNPPGGHSTRLW